MKNFILSFFVLLLFIAGCKDNRVVYKLNELHNNQILLDKWVAIGSFNLNPGNNLKVNNLERLGLSESSVTIDQLEALEIDSLDGISVEILVKDNYYIDFANHFNLSDTTKEGFATYAYCVLKSRKEQEIMLNFSANSGSMVWLNNELVLESDMIHKSFVYYDNYLPLNLKKGENLLLLKTRNNGSDWKMFACLENRSLEGENRHSTNSIIELNGNFLNRSFVDTDTLHFGWWLSSDFHGRFNIKGGMVDTSFNVNSRPQNLDLSYLSKGLYKITYYNDKGNLAQHFYKGDFYTAFNNKLSLLKSMDLCSVAKNNIIAYEYRYKHMLKSENIPTQSYNIPNWQRRMIFLYKGLEAIYNKEKGDSTSLSNISSYISDIDSAVQYYQLFYPENYNINDTLPLMIDLPVPMKRFNSKLETYSFADINGADLFSYMANKHRIIILKANFRTIDISNRNNIDEYDLFENINAVKNICNIDTTRIYMRGSCESALYALRLGAKHPDKWAAIALTSPRMVSYDDEDNPWLRQSNPVNILSNLWNVPILNIHSRLDEHTNISNSYLLNRLAKNAGLKNYHFKELSWEFDTHYSAEYIDTSIEFLLNYSLNEREINEVKFSSYQLKNPSFYWYSIISFNTTGDIANVHAKIKDNKLQITSENVAAYKLNLLKLPYNKNHKLLITDNGEIVFDDHIHEKELIIPTESFDTYTTKTSQIEGPFAHALINPFIIVPGTSGFDIEVQTNKIITDSFVEKWEALYDSKCRKKNDSEITKSDIANYNLILIGNEYNNSLIKNYTPFLPISTSSTTIQIMDKTISGIDLNFYLVFPNPHIKNRYLAVLGYNNPGNFILMSEDYDDICHDISNFGRYDFRIWSRFENNIYKGLFDKNWKVAIER